VDATLAILEMEPTVMISMNATTQMTVMVTQHAPTYMAIITAHVTEVTLEMERTAQILMSAQSTHTIATQMPAVLILKDHSHVLVKQDIQEMVPNVMDSVLSQHVHRILTAQIPPQVSAVSVTPDIRKRTALVSLQRLFL
jgi:uncharacterized protein YjiK